MPDETNPPPQDLQEQITQLRGQLEGRSEELARAESQRDEALSSLAAAQNRLQAQHLLSQAGVVDLETAGLLLAKRVDFAEDLDAETLRRGIEQLLLDKPFLRGASGAAASGKTASARPPSRRWKPATGATSPTTSACDARRPDADARASRRDPVNKPFSERRK